MGDYYRGEGERFLADRWREKLGKVPMLKERGYMINVKEQWSKSFEEAVLEYLKGSYIYVVRFKQNITLMKNRLIMGACRYGLLNDPDKPTWNRLERYNLEMKLFNDEGNLEHFIDAMNMLLLEWEEGVMNHDTILYLVRDSIRDLHRVPQLYFKPLTDNVKTREL